MKYRVSVLAVALLALQATTAAAHVGTGGGGGRGGGGGGGANWYLRAQDGSHQGPYGLSQLGEWTNAGYVSPGGLGNAPLGIPFVLQLYHTTVVVLELYSNYNSTIIIVL